jgi:colicin import membrane protein
MTTLHLNPQFDLSPPKESRQGASLVLAVLAHLLLLMALTWGISWNQEAILESSTAELWSSTPNLTNPAPPEPASLEAQEVAPTKALPPVQAKDNPSQLREAQLAIEKTKKKEEERAK